MNDTPVFIGGLQRSGTSLMRAIIGSHPDIAIYPSDLPLWTDFYNRYKDLDLNNRDQCDKLMHAIQSNDRVQQCQVRIDFNALRNTISAEPQLTINLVFGHFMQAYAREIGRPRWGLKTPYNEFFSEAIFSAFPTAKMIQLIRDPRDVAVSYKSYQKGAWKWRYNILLHIREWKKSVRLARENEMKYPGSYMTVRYEDLVLHPEKTMRQVCQRIHLDSAGPPQIHSSSTYAAIPITFLHQRSVDTKITYLGLTSGFINAFSKMNCVTGTMTMNP